MTYKQPCKIKEVIPQDQINNQQQNRIQVYIPWCTLKYSPYIIESEEIDKKVFPVINSSDKTGTFIIIFLPDGNKSNFINCAESGRKLYLQNDTKITLQLTLC